TIEARQIVTLAKDKGLEPGKEEMETYSRAMAKACKDLSFFHPVLGDAGGFLSVSGDTSGFHIHSFTDPESLLGLMEIIARGENINEVMATLEPNLQEEAELKKDRWSELIEICHQLETLAHKQLRGVELAKDEVDFIKSYGSKLASIMLYDGNSWLTPKDDAPRIAAVFNQPGEGFLLAGVGRPQEIRVLYPWKGREIECIGAVMPFREMRSPQHLSDEEWKAVLDSSSKPETPAWLKPITATP
ncbi:MAG TPA: DUF3160 domain-containing protein, partial [Luteolibacter sp.]